MNIEKLGITEGPWKVEGSEENLSIGNHSCSIFNGYSDAYDGWYEAPEKEDAQLIATAPEMLEALISSCSTFEWYTELHYKKHGVGHEKYTTNKRKFECLKGIIEKATNKPWEEIKELIDES